MPLFPFLLPCAPNPNLTFFLIEIIKEKFNVTQCSFSSCGLGDISKTRMLAGILPFIDESCCSWDVKLPCCG